MCGQRWRDSLGSILHDRPDDVLARQESVLAASPGGRCVTLDCLTLT